VTILDRIRSFGNFESEKERSLSRELSSVKEKLSYFHSGSQFIPVLGDPSKSGVVVNQEAVQNIDTFFACLRAIAEPIASLPAKVYKVTERGKFHQPTHPIQKLLNKPNTYQTEAVYFERAMYHCPAWGEHFAHIMRDSNGRAAGLHLIHPRDVWGYEFDLETGEIWWKVSISQDEWDQTVYPKRTFAIPGFDMIQVPILNEFVRGRSIITRYVEDFGHGIATRNYGSEFFGKSGKPSVWVETIDPKITPEANKAFAQNMASQSRESSVMLSYGRKMHQLSFPPEVAQFLQTKMFNVETICRIFNIPGPIVQHFKDGANYTSLETLTRNYAQRTLVPYTTKLEQEYSGKLFTEMELARGYRIEFDYSGILKADPKTRAEVNRTAIQNGYRTINEVRSEDGLNPVENGDRPIIQQNMAFLDELDTLLKSKHGNNSRNGNADEPGSSSEEEQDKEPDSSSSEGEE
jgi:HK97 family phage portal protein